MPYVNPREDAAKRIARALDSFERIYPHTFSEDGFKHYSAALEHMRAALEDARR